MALLSYSPGLNLPSFALTALQPIQLFPRPSRAGGSAPDYRLDYNARDVEYGCVTVAVQRVAAQDHYRPLPFGDDADPHLTTRRCRPCLATLHDRLPR